MFNYPSHPTSTTKVGIMLDEAYGGQSAFGERQLIIPAITNSVNGTPRETIATREWVNSHSTPENMMTTDTAQSITGVKKWYDSNNTDYLAIGQDLGDGVKCIEIGNQDRSYVTINKYGIDFGENSGINISLKDPAIASSTQRITLKEDKETISLECDSNKKTQLRIYNSEDKVGTKFNNLNINHYDDDLGTSYTYSYPSASGTLALTSDIPEIPDTSKFVTTDTEQEITGKKILKSTNPYYWAEIGVIDDKNVPGISFKDNYSKVNVYRDGNGVMQIETPTYGTQVQIKNVLIEGKGDGSNTIRGAYIQNKLNLGNASMPISTLYATNLSDGTTTKTMTEILSGTTEE